MSAAYHVGRQDRSARSAAPRQHQRGYTMIEILVALVIGLFLLGGMILIEQNVRSADANETGLSQLQDEERLAMSMLNDVVQAAGYFPNPAVYSASDPTYFGAFTPAGTTVALEVGQMIGGTTGGATASDTIVVRYMTSGSDNIINCTGGTGATVTTFVNVFTVDPATNQLLCSPDGVSTPVPLVNGVTQLSALYGVSTGPTNNVDTYLTATQVTAQNLWSAVTAVKVTVTFINPLYGQPGYTSAAAATVSFSRIIDLQSRAGVNTT